MGKVVTLTLRGIQVALAIGNIAVSSYRKLSPFVTLPHVKSSTNTHSDRLVPHPHTLLLSTHLQLPPGGPPDLSPLHPLPRTHTSLRSPRNPRLRRPRNRIPQRHLLLLRVHRPRSLPHSTELLQRAAVHGWTGECCVVGGEFLGLVGDFGYGC